MKTNSNVWLLAIGGVAIGVGGFFLIRYLTKKSKVEETQPQPTPFDKNSLETRLFQNFVLLTKGDKQILGQTVASANWDSNTDLAWKKYGEEYLNKIYYPAQIKSKAKLGASKLPPSSPTFKAEIKKPVAYQSNLNQSPFDLNKPKSDPLMDSWRKSFQKTI